MLDIQPISTQQIIAAAKLLHTGKAPACDKISDELLKDLDKPGKAGVLQFLHGQINHMLRHKQIQKSTATGRMIVFNKANATPKADQTRPIVSLSQIMRLIEALVLPSLHLAVQNPIHVSMNQVGFMKDCSTAMNLLRLTAAMKETKARKHKNHYCFFVDFKKAFDSVSHRILLRIINGIPEIANNHRNIISLLLSSYWASIDGKATIPINTDVPQGSVIVIALTCSLFLSINCSLISTLT